MGFDFNFHDPIKESVRLYFFHAESCIHCQKAKPHWNEFKEKHPQIMCLDFNAEGENTAALGFEIRGTPTYVLIRGIGAKADHDMKAGIMTCSQIEKWMGLDHGTSKKEK
jgi:thiol-disulfide isomerase/thioredoxin